MKKRKIAVLGLGTMGRSIVEGLFRAGQPKRNIEATARTPDAVTRGGRELAIRVGTDNLAAAARADLVVFALKPMKVLEVARHLGEKGVLRPGTLVVSIAAGVTPGIRPACPNVSGRTASNFDRISRDNPGIPSYRNSRGIVRSPLSRKRSICRRC